MAKRFGGKFSPDDVEIRADKPVPGAYSKARVDPAGAKSNVMFVPPLILAFRSITSGASELALGLVGAGLLLLAAWLLREGLNAEGAFHARKVARRPALPRKILAATLCGLGVAVAAFANEPEPMASLIYGVAAGVLHLGAFGADPLKDKGMEGVDTFQQDRVAKAVEQAEAHLRSMKDAVKRAGDPAVAARVDRFADTAQDLLRTVEEDPRDLVAAKKYLGVYLNGAKDAAVKFADIYARTQDRGAKRDFMMLLTDLEESFGQKTQKLLLDNNTDLTVEIDVLRERLQREGVRLD